MPGDNIDSLFRDCVRERKHHLPPECYQGEATVSYTACIADRGKAFTNYTLVNVFIDILSHSLSKHKCIAPVYCFMPDHVHLIVQGKYEDADSWRVMIDFKQSTGFWFKQKGIEFKWQKDFHDHMLRSEEDLWSHIRYVASNPVRKGLVTGWSDYPFVGSIGIDLKTVMS